MKTNHALSDTPKRPYRQGARAEAAARTAAAIVDAFYDYLQSHWYDDITLDMVAARAGVTVQTILRRFGSKEGVLDSVRDKIDTDVEHRRAVADGDVAAAVRAVVDDYEAVGDLVIRFLAQEGRIAAVRSICDFGRSDHRRWIADSFAPQLAGLDPATRAWRIDALATALDVYVWQLVRRDSGRDRADVERFMTLAVRSILDA